MVQTMTPSKRKRMLVRVGKVIEECDVALRAVLWDHVAHTLHLETVQLRTRFQNWKAKVDAEKPSGKVAAPKSAATAKQVGVGLDEDIGEYADYDPLDAHEPSSSAQAEQPSPPAASSSAFPASSSTATLPGSLFPDLSDPQSDPWLRATLEIFKSCPLLAYLGAVFAPDQRSRRLAGLRAVGVKLAERQVPKEQIMNAYVTEFSDLARYPVRMAELAILKRMQRAQEARHERKKAHGASGLAQRSKGKGKATAASFDDDSTSIPEIPSLASPLVASVDLASLWVSPNSSSLTRFSTPTSSPRNARCAWSMASRRTSRAEG
ncbi:hypothetical protein JCM10296v2_003927 [Rhodotorula toruloides]